ncbi:MAG TPA: NAD(P)-dependent oxidoreductase, partial [Candidatus Dormibacteraeota bacterium]|nr:NAD(P)-dependent oxidoreductase [Candidatus Dormibacteraeota bacterium]
MSRILVESPPFPLAVAREILAPYEVHAVRGRLPRDQEAVAYLGWGTVGGADMDRLPALRVIATPSVGFDHIDVEAASERGVWVCNVPDYCVDEMADTTITLLLAMLRGTVALERSVRDGDWDDHAAGPLRRIADTKLGIIGFGRIGREAARRAISLGMQVWATDVAVADGDINAAGVHAARLDD